jgi:TPR repeat protein
MKIIAYLGIAILIIPSTLIFSYFEIWLSILFYRIKSISGNPHDLFRLGYLLWNHTSKGKLGLKYLTEAANKGHPEAAYWLYYEYEHKDETVAYDWLRKSAELGYPFAQYLYAKRIEETTRDYASANIWFKKAADNGETNSLIIMGRDSNTLEAIKYLEKAAPNSPRAILLAGIKNYELGALHGAKRWFTAFTRLPMYEHSWIDGLSWPEYSTAMYYLGAIAEQGGSGVTQDFVEAHKWYNLALTLSDKYSSSKPKDALEKLQCKMSADQVAKAQLLAKNYKLPVPPKDRIKTLMDNKLFAPLFYLAFEKPWLLIALGIILYLVGRHF